MPVLPCITDRQILTISAPYCFHLADGRQEDQAGEPRPAQRLMWQCMQVHAIRMHSDGGL